MKYSILEGLEFLNGRGPYKFCEPADNLGFLLNDGERNALLAVIVADDIGHFVCWLYYVYFCQFYLYTKKKEWLGIPQFAKHAVYLLSPQ